MARSQAPKRSKGEELTYTRQPTHGPFETVAKISLGFDCVAVASPNWVNLSYTRQMALQEIFHKAARILCGDPDHADHWDDIGGYAELGKKDGSPIQAVPFAKLTKAKKVKPRPAVKAKKAPKAVVRRARPGKPRRVAKARAAVRPARPARPPRAARPVAPVAQAAE